MHEIHSLCSSYFCMRTCVFGHFISLVDNVIKEMWCKSIVEICSTAFKVLKILETFVCIQFTACISNHYNVLGSQSCECTFMKELTSHSNKFIHF